MKISGTFKSVWCFNFFYIEFQNIYVLADSIGELLTSVCIFVNVSILFNFLLFKTCPNKNELKKITYQFGRDIRLYA